MRTRFAIFGWFTKPSSATDPGSSSLCWPYAVAAGGERFLVNTSGGETADTPVTVVVNWPAAVKK